MTSLVQLVASETDELGYITYVFKCLEDKVNSSKYIMMVRYPNWDDKKLNLGDIGYVNFEEIRAGVDKWWDGKELVPYRYNTVQYIKFIYKSESEDHKYIM